MEKMTELGVVVKRPCEGENMMGGTEKSMSILQLVGLHYGIRCQSDVLEFNPTQSDVHRTKCIVMYLEFNTSIKTIGNI